MKTWRYIWPFLLAFVVWLFNTDWMVIPSLQNRALCILSFRLYDLSWIIPALSPLQIFFVICIVSTLDLIFWYYFLVWLRDLVFGIVARKEAVKEAIALGREIKTATGPALERAGLRDRIIDFLHRWLHWSFSETNPVVARLKRLGYWGLFSFSAVPETGARVTTIFICSLSKSRTGMLCVLLGNLVKNSFMVFAFWGPLSRFSPNQQFFLLSVIFLILLALILRKSKKT